ncbi:MAG: hypothetical protein RJB66_660 [Pseudomonadota bacterium]
MELFLVRHAIAEDRKTFILESLDDSLRPLTKDGKKKFRRSAKKIRDLIGAVDFIICSPFLRAQETALILKGFYPKTRQLSCDALMPNGKPEEFLRWYRSNVIKNAKKVILVGHEPQLSILASWLIFGSRESRITLKKGGALAIETSQSFDAKSAKLIWAVSPKVLGLS